MLVRLVSELRESVLGALGPLSSVAGRVNTGCSVAAHMDDSPVGAVGDGIPAVYVADAWVLSLPPS